MYLNDTFRFFCFANIIPVTVTANALGVRSFFADGTHIFAKCVTVALPDKSRRTHQMVIPNSHYLINLLRRFVRTAAITILTASGMRNGTTHIPRIVPTPIGVPLFV